MAVFHLVVLGHSSVPPGIDGGNWLTLGHALLGAKGSVPGITYPPVIPLLAVASVDLFGPIKGMAALAAATSVAPAIGAYLVLRSQRLVWVAAILAGFLAVGSPTSEATAWGGYPQLLGLGLSLLTLLKVDRYLRTGERKVALSAGVLLALDLATSHFTGLFTLAAGVIVVAAHVGNRDGALGSHRLWRNAWLIPAPCAVLVPVYWHLLPALAQEIPGPSASVIRNAGIGVSGLLGIVGLTAILATPLLLWRRRHDTLWIITTSVVLVTVPAYLLTREPRVLYFGPIAAVLVAATWLQELEKHPIEGIRKAGIVASLILAVALGVETWNSVGTFYAQRDFYNIAPPGTIAAANWLSAATPHNAVIAVTPIGGAPLGWWVAGLTQRPTYSDASLTWLAFPQERTRAQAADSIFSNGFPNSVTLGIAHRLGIQYLFVSKTWQGYDAQRVHTFERRHPKTVVFENSSVLIFGSSPIS